VRDLLDTKTGFMHRFCT